MSETKELGRFNIGAMGLLIQPATEYHEGNEHCVYVDPATSSGDQVAVVTAEYDGDVIKIITVTLLEKENKYKTITFSGGKIVWK